MKQILNLNIRIQILFFAFFLLNCNKDNTPQNNDNSKNSQSEYELEEKDDTSTQNNSSGNARSEYALGNKNDTSQGNYNSDIAKIENILLKLEASINDLKNCERKDVKNCIQKVYEQLEFNSKIDEPDISPQKNEEYTKKYTELIYIYLKLMKDKSPEDYEVNKSKVATLTKTAPELINIVLNLINKNFHSSKNDNSGNTQLESSLRNLVFSINAFSNCKKKDIKTYIQLIYEQFDHNAKIKAPEISLQKLEEYKTKLLWLVIKYLKLLEKKLPEDYDINKIKIAMLIEFNPLLIDVIDNLINRP